jgi:hypothetical protein
MKNIFQRLSGITLVLVMSFTLTGIASAAEAFPWSTNPKYVGYLPNIAGTDVKVKSTIQISAVSGPTYKVSVNLRLESLKANEVDKLYVYQAWLVDSETGYRMSIGSTVRKNNGTGDMGFTQYMSYPKIFDKLEVTKELVFDLDPAPSGDIVYKTDLNIPAFTELGYKTTLSSKNVVPAIPNSNKGGSGKFTINTKNNTVKYRIEFKNIPATGRVVQIYGPARPGGNGGKVADIATSTTNVITGEWKYNDSMEDKLIHGEYYIQVDGANNVGITRGQIIF